ncbi:hypothetical protein V5G24_20465 [Xanthobacter sp. VTT E-85241]|jgi:hypothetical protein|uniref:hypothetical protein n=1 Tax=Roseixanthobacter finlandensis TaxID=3119922 RepID=UPI00372B47C2
MTEGPKESMDPAVAAFLSRLDAEDVPLLEKSMELTRNIAATATVIKWVIISAFGLVVAVAALGESLQKIAMFIRGH